jgi:hypothetical protein
MPISIEWGNAEKTIIVKRFWDFWDHSDVLTTLEIRNTMMAEVSHTVDVIDDFSAPFTADPTRLMSAIRRAEKLMAPNMGIIVMVKANKFIRMLVDLNRLNTPRLTSRVCMVDSLEEAYDLLKSRKNSCV